MDCTMNEELYNDIKKAMGALDNAYTPKTRTRHVCTPFGCIGPDIHNPEAVEWLEKFLEGETHVRPFN